MAQYNITVNDEVLKGLFTGEKGVAQLLEQVLNQVLQAQATEQLQAEPYERSEERRDIGMEPALIRCHPGGNADFACSSSAKWQVFHGVVCTLSTKRTSLVVGACGNGDKWRVHKENGRHHGRTLW